MDTKTKKIITEEWLRAFPGLSAYAQNKLYKIMGPFLCGIELINLPRSANYRPHFVIYSLYKEDLESCLKYPTLMFEFHDSKKLQLDLPYDDAYGEFKLAQSIVSSSLKIQFNGNVSLGNFFGLVDDNLKNNMIFKFHSGKIASLLELKFYAALFVNSEVEMNAIINQIQIESEGWDMQIFEKRYGRFDKWIQKLQVTMLNRYEFLEQIEANKQNKKILRLKNSELTA